jgi:hypothetical protein
MTTSILTVTVTEFKPPKRQPTPNAVGPALGLRQTTGVGLMTTSIFTLYASIFTLYAASSNAVRSVVHLDV